MKALLVVVMALLVAAPAAAREPMPFELLYEGTEIRFRSNDVRVIESQAELELFYAAHAEGVVPQVDFTSRRVLALAVQRPHACALDVAVERQRLGPADAVTLTTHEAGTCLTMLVVQVRVVSVPRFSGFAGFRSGNYPTEVYGYDITA